MQENNPAPITEVSPPPPRPEMVYGRVQVAALCIVGNGEVASVPPHVSAGVVAKDNPGQIIALCGPESDLGAVQDAVVFSRAYHLRDALRALLTAAKDVPGATRNHTFNLAVSHAQAELDAADPQFMEMRKPSAEERLGEAREGFDPALTPPTTGILANDTVVVDGVADAGAAVITPAIH